MNAFTFSSLCQYSHGFKSQKTIKDDEVDIGYACAGAWAIFGRGSVGGQRCPLVSLDRHDPCHVETTGTRQSKLRPIHMNLGARIIQLQHKPGGAQAQDHEDRQ